MEPHSRKSKTFINFIYQKLFLVAHPIQSYNSVAVIAMNTDGQFPWSVFVQLLHHQKQVRLSLSGCLFASKCVWDVGARSSCWQDLTGVVCNWTLKARLTAVKPFNVCHRQMWEFLRYRVRKGCLIISIAGKQICGSNALDEETFSWSGPRKFKGSRAFTLQAKTFRLILHPWRCNDHLLFINWCMDAWY